MAFSLKKLKTFEFDYEGKILHIYTPTKELFDKMNELIDVLNEAQATSKLHIDKIYEFLAEALSTNKENETISMDFFVDYEVESVISLLNEYMKFVTDTIKN